MPAPTARRWSGLLVARGVGMLGDQSLSIFIPIAVFGTTRSIGLSGVAFAIQWLPSVVSMPIAGALVDRFRADAQLPMGDILRSLVVVTAGLGESLPWLVAAGAVVSLFGGHSTVALETALVRSVPPAGFARIQAQLQAVQQVAMVAGPALASGLVVLDLRRAAWLIAGLYSASAILTASFGRFDAAPAPSERSHIFERMLEGFRILNAEPAPKALAVLTLSVNLPGALALASLSPIIIGRLGGNERHVSYVITVAMILSLATALAVSRVAKRAHVDSILLPTWIGLVVGVIVVASAPNVIALAIGFALWASAVAAYAIWMRTWRARVVPTAMFGSVLGAFMVVILGSTPLAGALLAVLGETITPQAGIAVTGAAGMVFGYTALKRFRDQTSSYALPPS